MGLQGNPERSLFLPAGEPEAFTQTPRRQAQEEQGEQTEITSR